MAETPVEPVQLHYMRVGERRGHLGEFWRDGWQPEQRPLLNVVLSENRRYLRTHCRHVLKELELRQVDGRWECSDAMRQTTGGLSYAQMLDAAEKSGFRQMLLQLAETTADMFAKVIGGVPDLKGLPVDEGPTWDQLLKKWR
jgi:phage terminase large subunit GpA-like protein